ncbi:hypothetical protein [Haloarcula brevis]|uniref:hypothetical protein n=1 Tax=Haloarcula brevis TaxID=3111453 RepID=UPI00300EE404
MFLSKVYIIYSTLLKFSYSPYFPIQSNLWVFYTCSLTNYTYIEQWINEPVDADVVMQVPEDHVLVHEPSGFAFDSLTQLAVFHRDWTAGHNADAEEE